MRSGTKDTQGSSRGRRYYFGFLVQHQLQGWTSKCCKGRGGSRLPSRTWASTW